MKRWSWMLVALWLFCPPLPAEAKVLLTVDEALELAFPGCEVKRRTVYLTAEQKARAEQLAGLPIFASIVHPYDAVCEGEPAGSAYFDVHRVRTLAETLMIVVGPDSSVLRIEVLSFQEPEVYLPGAVWYAQFRDKKLGPELVLRRSIRSISGATLTARVTTDAVRRTLAIHAVLQ